MKINIDPKKIEEILSRGVEKIIDKDCLRKKLLSGEKLRIKHGLDPTGPKIHLGRAVQFLKLKEFQDLGHRIILIIGDFTAQIGDASDKTAMRQPLSKEEVKENSKSYLSQIGKILNLKKTEIYYNSRWLNQMTINTLISLAMKFTAQQMIQRRNFKERWENKKPIGLHELLYPIFQGYDSVAVRADIEIGGSDQLFNLKTGRIIQEFFGQAPQNIIALKMLLGTDNKKMSTSCGNVINITDEPFQMYSKIMSMNDEIMPDYLEHYTRIPLKELEIIKKDLKNKKGYPVKCLLSNKVNPKEIKSKLAKEITALFYDKKTASVASEEFERIFKEKKLPSEIPEILIKEKNLNILEFLVKTNLVSSKGMAKRLILQKGIKINNEIQNDWKKDISIKKGLIVQAGKRKFVKII